MVSKWPLLGLCQPDVFPIAFLTKLLTDGMFPKSSTERDSSRWISKGYTSVSAGGAQYHFNFKKAPKELIKLSHNRKCCKIVKIHQGHDPFNIHDIGQNVQICSYNVQIFVDRF